MSGLPAAEPCPCGGSTVPAMVELCPACGEVGDVLSMFAAGVDPRFTDGQREGMADARARFVDLVGIGAFDRAVAALRDELAGVDVRTDELYAFLQGAAMLIKLAESYAPGDFPPGTDAPTFAFGVIGALVHERLGHGRA